ncbi:MAG: hypothetical protein AAF236_02330 [Verrucomicrobiota bacterium]
MVCSSWLKVVAGVTLLGSIAEVARAQAFNDFDLAPHSYYSNERADRMSLLLARVEAGDVDLGTERQLPLLERLLEELEIPVSSQILLFSKTSLQRKLITPSNPRAMYFNDDTHLAWMPGGKMEIISFDSESGGRFFIEESPFREPEPIVFDSPKSCFGCHGGSATNYLPGPLARSNFTSETGGRLGSVAVHIRMSHEVAFEDRWGGYFVTGAPASLAHLGNSFAQRQDRTVYLDRESHREMNSLDGYFDPAKFPATGSHIVNLLVFDHQIEAHNRLIEARYRHRQVEYETNKFGRAISKTRVDTERFFDRLVDYLLFTEEVPLTGHSIERNPAFEEAFRSRRKTGPDGRSLRDFDLENHIFANRLSYMIQTPAFTDAPLAMRERVYSRLRETLVERDSGRHAHVGRIERERILSILMATHPDFLLPSDRVASR